MDSLMICLPLLFFNLGGYLLWPSRYNVVSHLGVGGSFISVIVPSLILNVHEEYPQSVVDLYTNVLVLGFFTALPAAIIGFMVGKRRKTKLSFEVMDVARYEQRVVRLTLFLLITAIIGLIISYLGMGFVPMFADDPISAKLFRAQYQQPYMRVAVIFRTSFFILGTIIPIACIIWYKRNSALFFFAILAAVMLMVLSLQRSGAFGGLVFAFAIIMSFKSRTHFVVMMLLTTGIFVLSSFFYYLIGVRVYEAGANVWKIIAAGASDIQDHLQFLIRFEENPVWTYGRTIYGGLIPGHYKWNPSVYTLSVIAPGIDINDVGSGGIRLPLPLWGYVAFEWIGVILFSGITSFLGGYFLGILRTWIKVIPSLIVKTTAIMIYSVVFGSIAGGLVSLNMFMLPPIFIMFFYMYRFRLK